MVSTVRILTGILCLAAATTIAYARPKPVGCAEKVCVQWAKGAPGTFVGKCIKYETKYYLHCTKPVVR